MHHTFGYQATITSTAENEINAVTDNALTIQNNHIIPQRDSNLLYAAACGATITRARLNTPKLGVITSPHIVQLNAALTFGNPQMFQDYFDNPLLLRGLEELQVFVTHTAATAEQNAFVGAIDTGRQLAPPGDIYTIRGTAVGTLVANSWTNVGTITWNNTLPTGQYMIVGGTFFSATALAGRFILENIPWRPGSLAIQSLSNRIDKRFRFGDMGVWGLFHNTAMPQVEILATGADAAETIFMDIIKVQ